MSRADEIAQGLRHEGGALTFPLDALEYQRGYVDYREGIPPPRLTSDSYDLGRALGQRREEEAGRTAELLAAMRAEDLRRRDVIREMLSEKPEVLAEFDAKMAEMDAAREQREHSSPLPTERDGSREATNPSRLTGKEEG